MFCEKVIEKKEQCGHIEFYYSLKRKYNRVVYKSARVTCVLYVSVYWCGVVYYAKWQG